MPLFKRHYECALVDTRGSLISRGRMHNEVPGTWQFAYTNTTGRPLVFEGTAAQICEVHDDGKRDYIADCNIVRTVVKQGETITVVYKHRGRGRDTFELPGPPSVPLDFDPDDLLRTPPPVLVGA